MKLYGYFRSSAAYRVRIALNLKGIQYEDAFLNLREGEQKQGDYAEINPQQLLPTLDVEGQGLTQSLSIIEYLEAVYPQPALLPEDEIEKARVRAASQVIACDIHPLDNLRVLKYLKSEFNQSQDAIDDWYRHWITEGFRALEKMVNKSSACCFGEEPGLADIVLAPQMYNARRFETDLSEFPRLLEIDKHIMSLTAFSKAAPENQPDAL